MIEIQKSKRLSINPKGEMFSSVGNVLSSAKTFITLSYDEDNLIISFRCENNTYLKENTYTKDNDTLYKQEVLEVFVARGVEAPLRYLEIEINKNNALFVGEIYNPSGIGGETKILKMMDEAISLVQHSVSLQEDSWAGEIAIPFSLIDTVSQQKDAPSYMINFYRVLFKDKQESNDWSCKPENSEFLCYKSTHSPVKPNFHISESMQQLFLD
jgi:hypothetical protein